MKTSHSEITAESTIAEGKDWLRDHLRNGTNCPLCTQFAKTYRRKLNAGIAFALIFLYRYGKTGWVHKPTVLKGVGSAARDESIARYWGLIEEEVEVRRDDGGRAGYWRITSKGEDWIHGRIKVPKYALIYDSRCLGHEGEQVAIRDCLGSKFDYDELMAGV